MRFANPKEQGTGIVCILPDGKINVPLRQAAAGSARPRCNDHSISDPSYQKEHHPVGWCSFCERLPKRSRIEVRKPKSTPLFLIEIDVQMLLKTKPIHNIMINNII